MTDPETSYVARFIDGPFVGDLRAIEGKVKQSIKVEGYDHLPWDQLPVELTDEILPIKHGLYVLAQEEPKNGKYLYTWRGWAQ